MVLKSIDNLKQRSTTRILFFPMVSVVALSGDMINFAETASPLGLFLPYFKVGLEGVVKLFVPLEFCFEIPLRFGLVLSNGQLRHKIRS